MRSNHSNMLVYLKGISSDKLGPVIDFIYNGKIFLKQEELRAFIETGKELLVKGLESEMTEVVKSTNQISPHSEGDENEYEDLMCEKALKSNADDDKDTENKTDEKNLQFRIDYEISLQLNEMTEKIEGVWICKVCGKTATQKGGIRRHAEAHIYKECLMLVISAAKHLHQDQISIRIFLVFTQNYFLVKDVERQE